MADVTQAVGKLVVAVTTAQGTIPLPGALVTVSAQTEDGPVLYRIVRTDTSGRTPVLELPAPSLSDSLSPDQPTPYLNYTVNVSLPGYQIAEVRDISIFPGIKSTLPVPLTPSTASGSRTIDYRPSCWTRSLAREDGERNGITVYSRDDHGASGAAGRSDGAQCDRALPRLHQERGIVGNLSDFAGDCDPCEHVRANFVCAQPHLHRVVPLAGV